MKTLFKIYILWITCGVVLCACNKEPTTNQQIKNIAFYKLNHGKKDSLSLILDKSKIIRLRSFSKTDLIGSVSAVKFNGNRFYVLDQRMKKIVVYDYNGYPLNILNHKGRGPNEYLSISDFCVTADGTLVVSDARSKKILFYDENLSFIKYIKVPFAINAIHHLPNNQFLVALYAWNQGKYSDSQVVLADSDFNIINTLVRYTPPIDPDFILSTTRFVTNNEKIFYHRAISDDIYTFDQSGKILCVYHLDFGNMAIPDKYKINTEQHYINHVYKDFTTLEKFAIVKEDRMYGTLFNRMKDEQFCANLKNKRLYIEADEVSRKQRGIFVGATQDYIIAFLPHEEDTDSETKNRNMESLTNDNKFSIILYEI